MGSFFTKDWIKAGDDEGFDYFHMVDFMAKPERKVKPFCDWDDTKKKRVYYRLVRIINSRARKGFGFAVPVAAFDHFASPRIKQEVAKDAFTFAVQSVLSFIKEWYAEYGQGKTIHHVFEKRKSMGHIQQIWDLLEEDLELAAKIGARSAINDGISFQNPRVSKPLQAADILAWNQYAHMRDVISKGIADAPENVRPYFDVLRAGRPMHLGFLSESQTEKTFAELAETEQRTGKRGYRLPAHLLKLYGEIKTSGT